MKIGLLGCGVVGSGVYEIIENQLSPMVSDIEIVKILVKTPEEITSPKMTNDASEVLENAEIDTIVEAMGGLHPAHEFIVRALKSGKIVVTANKAVLAHYMDEFVGLAKENHVNLLFEASVGGGVPWIKSLRSAMRIDDITYVGGVLNGTTNLILSTMEEQGISFDKCLKTAQEMGYAEANPTADIDGIDVRNKIIISTSLAAKALVREEDVMTFGIRTVQKCDLDYFASINKSIRLFADGVIEHGSCCCRVEPALFSTDAPEASIKLNFNICTLKGKTIGPLKFIGQGAGKYPTANAIVQDVIDINTNNQSFLPIEINGNASIDNSLLSGRYYIRFANDQKAKLLSSFKGLVDNQFEQGDKNSAIITKDIKTFQLHNLLKGAQLDMDKIFVARL